ncbi:MAG: AtpZ/AtpI family protein [Candidatus Falkowbacteria bacterium]
MAQGDRLPNTPWWQPGLFLFFKLSSWIVTPILLAVFFGKALDRHFGTEPWLFLLTVGIAFVFSMVALVIQSTREIKRIEQEELKRKHNEQNRK